MQGSTVTCEHKILPQGCTEIIMLDDKCVHNICTQYLVQSTWIRIRVFCAKIRI